MDTALAVSLVPYFAPKHHSQATRLLKGVLDAEPTNSEARFARAQISQEAGKWAEARKGFQYILDQGGDTKEMVAAKEELGWCFVNEGKLTEGRDLLEEVVETRDAMASELPEGKEDEDAFGRARAWWRLGQTEWKIGGKSSLTLTLAMIAADNFKMMRARNMPRNGSWLLCVPYRPMLLHSPPLVSAISPLRRPTKTGL